MPNIADQSYLREQYKNAANLNDRIQLHARFSTNRHDFQVWVFEQLKLAPDSRVLELGCGPGSLWWPNMAHGGPSLRGWWSSGSSPMAQFRLPRIRGCLRQIDLPAAALHQYVVFRPAGRKTTYKR